MQKYSSKDMKIINKDCRWRSRGCLVLEKDRGQIDKDGFMISLDYLSENF